MDQVSDVQQIGSPAALLNQPLWDYDLPSDAVLELDIRGVSTRNNSAVTEKLEEDLALSKTSVSRSFQHLTLTSSYETASNFIDLLRHLRLPRWVSFAIEHRSRFDI